MSISITFANQKGGVGKTTSTNEIATILAARGKRVLAIDLDQQCNLTKNSDAMEGPTIYDLFKSEEPDVEGAIQHVETGYDIIPGDPAMSKASSDFADTPDAYLLQYLIESLDEDYDYILVDSAPARDKLLNMCYLASDYFIMCADSGEDSLDGIEAITNDMMAYHKSGKKALSDSKILGTIITRYRKTNIGKAILELVEDMYENTIPEIIKVKDPFVMTVRETAAVDEAKMMHKPVQSYKRSATASMDYRYIADEIQKRLEDE